MANMDPLSICSSFFFFPFKALLVAHMIVQFVGRNFYPVLMYKIGKEVLYLHES